MASPVSDTYSVGAGEVIRSGRVWVSGMVPDYIRSMRSGEFADISGLTNIAEITDDTGPGTIGWLESAANYMITGWPGKSTYDPVMGNVVLVGASQGYSDEDPAGVHSKAVYFDLETGLFSAQWNPFNGVNISHVYDGNPSVALNGYSYRRAFNSSNLYRCTLATKTWESIANLSSAALSDVTALDVFPEMGIAGAVLLLSSTGKLTRYDISTGNLSTIGTPSGMVSYPVMHYVKGQGYVVFGSGTSSTTFYKVTEDQTITQIANTLPGGLDGVGSYLNRPMAPDPAGRAKSWLFETNLWSLDHATGAWEDHGVFNFSGTYSVSPCPVYDLGAFIILHGIGRASSSVSLSKVYAYKV